MGGISKMQPGSGCGERRGWSCGGVHRAWAGGVFRLQDRMFRKCMSMVCMCMVSVRVRMVSVRMVRMVRTSEVAGVRGYGGAGGCGCDLSKVMHLYLNV